MTHPEVVELKHPLSLTNPMEDLSSVSDASHLVYVAKHLNEGYNEYEVRTARMLDQIAQQIYDVAINTKRQADVERHGFKIDKDATRNPILMESPAGELKFTPRFDHAGHHSPVTPGTAARAIHEMLSNKNPKEFRPAKYRSFVGGSWMRDGLLVDTIYIIPITYTTAIRLTVSGAKELNRWGKVKSKSIHSTKDDFRIDLIVADSDGSLKQYRVENVPRDPALEKEINPIKVYEKAIIADPDAKTPEHDVPIMIPQHLQQHDLDWMLDYSFNLQPEAQSSQRQIFLVDHKIAEPATASADSREIQRKVNLHIKESKAAYETRRDKRNKKLTEKVSEFLIGQIYRSNRDNRVVVFDDGTDAPRLLTTPLSAPIELPGEKDRMSFALPFEQNGIVSEIRRMFPYVKSLVNLRNAISQSGAAIPKETYYPKMCVIHGMVEKIVVAVQTSDTESERNVRITLWRASEEERKKYQFVPTDSPLELEQSK